MSKLPLDGIQVVEIGQIVAGFSVRHQAPAVPGQHTSEVLTELGYTVEEIETLARKAPVRGPGLPEKSVSDS